MLGGALRSLLISKVFLLQVMGAEISAWNPGALVMVI